MARTLTWIRPDGGRRKLTDRANGIGQLLGAAGLMMPSFATTVEETPQLDGEQVLDTWAVARDVEIPLRLVAPGWANFKALVAGLADDFDPTAGDGWIESEDDGVVRRLRARYTKGLEGGTDLQLDDSGLWLCAPQFRVSSPWWWGNPVSASWSFPAPTAFLPITPRVVSSSRVLGDASLVNSGSAEADPVWTITPPGNGIYLARPDTGEYLELAGEFTQTLTIDTRPGQQDIYLADGTPFWDRLVDGSSFWRLPRGTSPLQLNVPGANVGTTVTVRYDTRHRLPFG